MSDGAQGAADARGTMLLIDGHSMAFRAFYALRADNFVTKQGQYTNAVHGFTNTLLRLIKDYKPTHVAVAFDLPGGTFRTRMYADYKGGRKATPEEFKGQVEVIQEVLEVLGISWLTYEDFEADDIVATLSTKAEAAGMRVYLASGDKDSYQLVSDAVTILYPMPRSQMLEMTPKTVAERTGVTPDKYEDVAALVGEGADNIPGVPGVGPKTAAKWINEYGSLGALLEGASEIKSKAGQALRDHTEQVKLNRQLNALVRDLPIGEDFDALKPRGVAVTELHQLFDTLDFNSLRSRVLRELPAREGSDGDGAGGTAAGGADSVVRELQEVQAAGKAEFCSFARQHAGPYGLALSGVTTPGKGSVAMLAIAAQDGAAVLVAAEEIHSAEIKTWLADSSVPKITHGAKGLMHALAGASAALDGVIADVELEAYVRHPDRRSYLVADLAQQYLAIEIDIAEAERASEAQEALDLGLTAAEGTHAEAQLTACDRALARSAVTILNVHDALIADVADQPHWDKLMELELAVSRVLFVMEHRGIAVDQRLLNELRGDFAARVQSAARFAHEAIGDDEVNLSSPKQLQKVLFEDLGLPKTKKTKSGYTTNAAALADLLAKIRYREDEIALAGQQFLSSLLEHRDAIKLLQSVEGLERAVHPDGRIRTTYQQAVAATGRLSSTDPNLQNIHARTEEGLQIRGVFVPGESFDYLLTADYSQIEMRLMAHLSGDEELIAAFNAGADLHRYVAGRVFGVPEDSVTPAQRSRIKAMSYGLVYGLSAFGLAAQLKIAVPEAQALMDGYFSRFGKVKRYLDGLVQQARRDGYTETMLGRRRYLPELASTNRQVREAAERMALNAPIQGSAADIIKIAMVHVEESLAQAELRSRVLLQVHDELVLEVVASEAEQVREIVEREMGNAWPALSVPLTVSTGLGRSWRDAAH